MFSRERFLGWASRSSSSSLVTRQDSITDAAREPLGSSIKHLRERVVLLANPMSLCLCKIAIGYILVTTMQCKQPIGEQKSMHYPIASCNHYICMGASGIRYFNRLRWGKAWEYPEYGEVCWQCLGHFPMFCSQCHLIATHFRVMCPQGVVLKSVSPEIEPDTNQSQPLTLLSVSREI